MFNLKYLQHVSTPVHLTSRRQRENCWNLRTLLTLSDEELREKCIAAKKQGLFGVHAQALNFLGLWNAARKRNIPFDLTIDPNGLMEFNEE